MNVLAIDPGNIESAYVMINADYVPILFGKENNYEARRYFLNLRDKCLLIECNPVIEMIGHYGTGMSAGRTVYDTCIWIGRFTEILHKNPELIGRKTVVAHICGSAKAKDSNVIQALIDRFAPDTPNYGKGTKKDPGWFYGFSADVWQAYALAVTYMDIIKAGGEL
jgi:hypothetical protein